MAEPISRQVASWDGPERRSQTLDTIDAMSSIDTLPRLVDYLGSAFSDFGIDHFVIAGLPNPHERFEKVLVLKHWAPDWFDAYTKGLFFHDDPVVRMCRTTTMPFEWTEAPFDRDREPRAVELMNLRVSAAVKVLKGNTPPSPVVIPISRK